MQKSYRLKANIGVDKEIRLNIEQDFDFLEILSLKLRQEEVYNRYCSDYGVIAGRVIVNGGFGVPNVKVSVFVPLENEDENNPIISTLYPYKTPSEKNEDGFRYNLLPYEKQHGGHTPTGTFPTKEDILIRKEVLEVYEKYYKYTVKTNDSGDFMIVGVPLGTHKVVMDCDLSDIGEFSLRPYDFIRMGLATQNQFNGSLFKSSENIDSLPQIIHNVVDIEVTPFWGEDDLCNIGITRVDFDLREQGIEITPHSVFMGSIISTNEDDYIKSNCKPKNTTGELCGMVTGPGQILAIRQTVDLDENGLPVLEEYKLEDGGFVIDENGTWMVDLPMNMDYIITNEFGEQVITTLPNEGIPTTSKYRFKIKWLNEGGLTKDLQRANYLVPNIKEHGWVGDSVDDRPSDDVINKSYAFSLDWNDYYDVQSAINCEDTFYKFIYNKVYTISSHIDRFKWGNGRRKHIGIKDITNRECITENNRFPTNDASKKMGLNMLLFDLFMIIATNILIVVIPLIHIVAVLYNIIAFIINALAAIVNIIIYPICVFIAMISRSRRVSDCRLFPENGLLPRFNDFVNISLPMLSYPDCDRCSCSTEKVDTTSEGLDDANAQLALLQSGAIANVTSYGYFNNLTSSTCCPNNTDKSEYYKFIVSGYDDNVLDGYGGADLEKRWRPRFFKSPVYPTFENCDYDEDILDNAKKRLSPNVTLAQSLNLMNRKIMYNGQNRSNAIQTTLINDQLPGPSSQPFTDNVMIVLCDWGTSFESGSLITMHDLNNIADPNTQIYSNSGGNQFNNNSITGTCSNWSSQNLVGVNVKYQKIDGSEGNSTVYIHNPIETRSYKFKSGVEYFQVITGMTLNDVAALNLGQNNDLFKYHIFNKKSYYSCDPDTNLDDLNNYVKPYQFYQNYNDLKVYIMVRGVDVWTPKQKIKYDLSKVFGRTSFNNSVTVEGEFYMNVPTQRNNNVQNFDSPGLSANPINDHRFDEFTPNPHYERNGLSNDFQWFSNDNNGVSAGGTISGLFHKPYSGFIPNSQEWIPYDTYSFNKYSSIDGQVKDRIDQDYGFDIDTFSPDSSNVIDNPDENNTPYNTSNPQIRIDGCGYQFTDDILNNGKVRGGDDVTTVSSLYLPRDLSDAEGTPKTSMVNPENLIFRSDRLPSSDSYEFANYDIDSGVRKEISRYVLHLNDAFQMFNITETGEVEGTTPNQVVSSVDASGDALDFFEGNERLSFVSNTFTCEGYVPLFCYSGSGEDFGVEEDCEVISTNSTFLNNLANFFAGIDGRMTNGCYNFVKPVLIITIPFDWYFLLEWRSRLRYMYYVCQGVISQEFYNNWVNGTLYMPSFIKKTFFNDGNEFESYEYCGDPVSDVNRRYQGPLYFNTETNSFFYRSTPYGDGVYYGQKPSKNYVGRNQKNIWFPTTIMDLGPRDEFTRELSLTDEFEGYVVDKLKSTSYQDISDIVIVFVLSRLVNASVVEVILSYGDASINSIFSRELGVFNPLDGRIDGDFAQLVSINSEFGVLKYSDTNYIDSLYFGKNETFVGQVLDFLGLSTSFLGIWFDSDTNLRKKLTPGESVIGNLPTNPSIVYNFENSQDVPFYMWYIDPDGTPFNVFSAVGLSIPNTLFGSQLNTWNTEYIYNSKYQQDNFDNSNMYMKPDGGYGLGHIFNKEGDGPNDDQELITPPQNNPNQNNYKVGAPFHFYFGLKVGKTALTKFIKKYIGIEEL